MSPLSPTKQCNQAEALGFGHSAALLPPPTDEAKVNEADFWTAETSRPSVELHKQALYGKQPSKGRSLEAEPTPVQPQASTFVKPALAQNPTSQPTPYLQE